MDGDVSSEIITDLLRSAWIVERARATVYRSWAAERPALEASERRAGERAEMLARALERRGHGPDADLVDAHASWMTSLVGRSPGEVTFGDLLLARLGDWVDAHAGVFAGAERSRLEELGEQERATLTFPDRLPEPPPFEPLEPASIRPPGDVRLRIGILGDLHVGSAGAEEMASAAIDDLNASGAELVVQLGDITEHGNRDEFERAGELLARLNVPVTTMMGNHDVFSLKEERLSGREYYPAAFGREPDGVLLEHAGFRLAVLDSIEHGTTPFAPFDLITGRFAEGPGGGVVRGSLTPPQHEILAELARPGSGPAFVFLHHPPQPFTSFPPVIFGLRDEDSGRLHATVDSGNVWGVFAGHTHRNARTRDFDGVPAHEVGIPRDFPFGYALIDASDEGYSYRFCQISNQALLERRYRASGELHRRYAKGSDAERAFVWRAPAPHARADAGQRSPVSARPRQ